MKMTYYASTGRFSVELEGDQKSMFEQVSSFQEVFENAACGKCKSEDLRFVVRTVDDNDFHELHCQNRACRARLAFGQHKQGKTLFPRRKNAANEWLPDNGWTRFNHTTGKEE